VNGIPEIAILIEYPFLGSQFLGAEILDPKFQIPCALLNPP